MKRLILTTMSQMSNPNTTQVLKLNVPFYELRPVYLLVLVFDLRIDYIRFTMLRKAGTFIIYCLHVSVVLN